MSIVDSELKMYRSTVVSDTTTNGGLLNNSALIVSNVVNNVWPSVFKAERVSGSTKYRKVFLKVANDNDETLYNPQVWLDVVTPGDDWMTFFLGTQTDVQNDVTGTKTNYGCGVLKTNVAIGAGSVIVTVENSTLASGVGAIFRNGDTIRITNKDTPSSITGTEELHVINGAPSVSGNDVTLTLTTTLANAYNTTDGVNGTRIMSVYPAANIVASFTGWVKTGTGAYDQVTYPVILDHIGTINQTVTLTFTGASTFTAASNVAGVTLTGGDTSVNYAPSNPTFSKPYFTLEAAGFSGTWTSGNTIVFTTVPAALPIWQKRVIPAGAGSLTGNRTVMVFTGESM